MTETEFDRSNGIDGGEAVVAALEAAGVSHIFCASGSEWAPVWEALARRHRDGVASPRYLDLLHETVAAGMATGYGLVTRRPSGVLLHAGPGLLQGAMAIHGALLAGVPLVALSSESITYGDGPGADPGGQWYRNLSHVGGPHTIAAPFTKWANQVGAVSVLLGMVTRSVEMSQRAPAGPVYLNVPVEVLLDPWTPPERIVPAPVPGGSVSSSSDIEAVVALLRTARRPVIVTETVGREAGGLEALVEFAEAFSIPVVEPSSAVCTNFPRTHPLHAGADLSTFLDDADVIVLVNCRAPFYPPSSVPSNATVVVVDEVPQRPHVVYQVLNASHYLEGGVPGTLRAAAALGRETQKDPVRVDLAVSAGAKEASAVATAEESAAAKPGIDPVALAVALRELLAAEDSVVVDETITHAGALRRHLRRDEPDSYFYVQGGLGQGMAVALGVKLASPEKTVAFTVGDGAFLYNPIVQSLQASKDFGLPLLIVVFNNHRYKSMQMNHLRFYPDGAAVETGEWLGVDLSGQPELSDLVAPFGFHGEAVASRDELRLALERALKSVREGVTALVNVSVIR
ncbi:MAG: thiamine pyrophosphate-binding protein [Actinomycetota bacterium]|nr:thiamine pyrophosphate-binding protein [Actinomycetota bacterium]